MAKHKERLNRNIVTFAYVIVFILGFTRAVLAYLTSTYFQQASGSDNVGVFYLISYAITLGLILGMHKIIEKVGKVGLFALSSFFAVLALAVLMGAPIGYGGIALYIFYLIAINVGWVGLDIILESVSVDKMSGRIRGAYLTIMNAGFLLGPFLGTKILDSVGFNGVFMVNIIGIIAVFVLTMVGLRKTKKDMKKCFSLLRALKKIFKRRNIMKAYYVSFLLDFFYFFMIIFAPLHLRNLGMSWSDIGIIFTIMLIPFVILQYPAGILADKKYGEKEMIIISLFVMAISTGTLFFISSTGIAIWAIVLFTTRVGASLIELLRDSYFFKRIDGTDVDIIDFFRTARSAAYIFGSALSAIILLFFPIKFVFLILGMIILTGIYPAFTLKDNK